MRIVGSGLKILAAERRSTFAEVMFVRGVDFSQSPARTWRVAPA
jgi:hypothetical protein